MVDVYFLNVGSFNAFLAHNCQTWWCVCCGLVAPEHNIYLAAARLRDTRESLLIISILIVIKQLIDIHNCYCCCG